MNVTSLSEPGVTRVELEGSIDGKTAPQIREELSAELCAGLSTQNDLAAQRRKVKSKYR